MTNIVKMSLISCSIVLISVISFVNADMLTNDSNNYRYSLYSLKENINFSINTSVSSVEKYIKDEEKKSKESISELSNDSVYAKKKITLKSGPGEKYSNEKEINKNKKLVRIGECNNGWNKVLIDNDIYYTHKSNITTEKPKPKVDNSIINSVEKVEISSGSKGDLQNYAKSLFKDYGWDEKEIYPLIKLWDRESGWNPNSHNSNSGAHGIPQALPGSKMSSEGSDWESNGETQIRWGLKYIKGRYGSPASAWNHFCSSGWY